MEQPYNLLLLLLLLKKKSLYNERMLSKDKKKVQRYRKRIKRLLHSSPQLDSIHFSLDPNNFHLLSCACFKNPYFIIGISSSFFVFLILTFFNLIQIKSIFWKYGHRFI